MFAIVDRDLLIKKLIYQSQHRGCKEMDYILGRFGNFENLSKINDNELNLYEELLNEDDLIIYEMITQKRYFKKYNNLIKLLNSTDFV